MQSSPNIKHLVLVQGRHLGAKPRIDHFLPKGAPESLPVRIVVNRPPKRRLYRLAAHEKSIRYCRGDPLKYSMRNRLVWHAALFPGINGSARRVVTEETASSAQRATSVFI